ncbi:MAG: hypothetical protein WBM28_04665 [Burkholderiales bacterium]
MRRESRLNPPVPLRAAGRRALAALALGLLAWAPGRSLGAETNCAGGSAQPLTGAIKGNVSVPVGATCVINSAEIFGDVRVFWNGNISLYQTKIHGDFTAIGATAVRFNSLGKDLDGPRGSVTVDGDVTIKESHFAMTSGFGEATVIGKDLVLKRNRAAEKGVVFVMCPAAWCRPGSPVQVMGDVGIRWNQVPIEINNIHIGGDLNCRDNAGQVVAPPNDSPPSVDIAFRHATGQCAKLLRK